MPVMPRRAVRIESYFSIPTDLAAEMRSWPEFVAGDGYEVSLRSDAEEVSISLEHDEGHPFVQVSGEGEGPLFHRVLGLTVYALAGHSDEVWPRVMRCRSGAPRTSRSGSPP